jgi:uncharacterized protein (DUF58 family)
MTRSNRLSLRHHLRLALSLPTARAVTVAVAAFLIYLFANQTQVGWMYVMAALLAGTVLAAWWLNRRALHGVQVERRVGESPNAELYEGDCTPVTLTLRNDGRAAAAHIRTAERCPLAAPDSPHREMSLFVPALPARGGQVHFDYEVEIDRRGLHEFPPLEMTSRAPFGFFRRARRIELVTRVLVYPEVHPLRRLSLLDQQLTLQIAQRRAGVGTEILGVRPFHTGDSLRRIHWRSVARTGQLISKEFADETRPGLILALDLYRHPYPETESKHTPFEWAIKVAASIGDYARRRGYPLYLLADGDAWPAPTGPLSRLALLEYLARVQPGGERRLAAVLDQGTPPACTLVAALLPWPDPTVLASLVELRRRGLAVLAAVLDPASFPAGGPAAGHLADELQGAEVEARLIRFGEDWRAQLDPWRESRIEPIPSEPCKLGRNLS